ncbi:MAG: PspC domain-containing protein [Cyclobacteriaceae bacterium]
MKKTISINIGGIIFHIEEDAYDQLKTYLDSVSKYFASFDDNQEIISDIESRIAEIFLTKLADGRQTVNIEDVDELIKTMGTTKDFEATFENQPEEDSKKSSSEKEEKQHQETAEEENTTTDKRLYRDTKRKMLGGVASGIAHYFRIDPLWVRLLTLALFVNIVFVGFSGAILLAYIILWIVLPPNGQLPEDKKIKKLYRNNEERVLGGVAGGLASYFGTDTTVIRLLFVLAVLLGGSGILIYIVLWIITPEAKTITQKMQMQGEPVTLSNIEQNVKRGLKVKEGEENPLVKILLFPFRLISLIIQGISKILGPALKLIVEIIRIAFGALVIIVGFSLMIAFIVTLLGLSGYGFVNEYLILGNLPIDLVNKTLNIWVVLFSFLVVFIPAVALSLLGLVIIFKRRVANAYVGWSLFALWIIGLIGTSFSVPSLVREFRSENTARSEQIFPVAGESIPTLRLNALETSVYKGVQLRLKGHEDSVYQAMLSVESRGNSRPDATLNAESISYTIDKKGNDFLFDSNITFPENANFRFQELDVTFFIPYGQKFRMERDLEEILVSTISINGYRAYQMEGNDWVFEPSGLKCLTCQGLNYDADRGSLKPQKSDSYKNKDVMNYPFEDFREVKIASFFDIEITKGEFSVVLKGDNKDLDEVYLNQVGDRLEVKFKDDNKKWWKDNFDRKIQVVISMPELLDLEIEGACSGSVYGFDEGDMNISLSGATEIEFEGDITELDISLRGASKLKLTGRGDYYDASLDGASELNASKFIVKRIRIDTQGASKASVFANEEINIESNGMSNVKYSGTRNVSIDENGMSNVRRD